MSTEQTLHQSKRLSSWILEYGVLASIIAILGWFSLRFYRIYGQEFFAVSGDDVYRTLLALKVLKGDWIPSALWPPLSFWINAFAIQVFPDYFHTPALVNSIFATCTLFFYYGTTRELGSSKLGAYLSVILVANVPIFFWLRVSGLADPIFQAGVFLALWGILRWLDTHSKGSFAVAAIGLTLANGIRVEGWVISGLWGLTVLLHLVHTWNIQRPTTRDIIFYLIGFLAIGLFPVFWMTFEAVKYGDPFFYVSVTREYVMTFGVQSLFTRLTVFPKILLFGISPWVLLFAVPGLVLGWQTRRKVTSWLIGLCVILLIVVESGAVRYVIASAFRERLMLLIFMLSTIPLGLLLGHCLSEPELWKKMVSIAIFITILVPLVAAQTPPPDGVSSRVRRIGACLQRTKEISLQTNDKIMIELVPWDYLLIPVLSRNPHNILLDRRDEFEFGPAGSPIFAADNPSVFDIEPDTLARHLEANQVRAVVIRHVSDRDQFLAFMVPVFKDDVYTVYLQSDYVNPHCQ